MGPAILLLLHEVRILVRVPPTLHLCDGCAAEPSVGPLDVDLLDPAFVPLCHPLRGAMSFCNTAA